MIIVGNSSAASFVKVTIENAKLAEICSSHGGRMTVSGSTLSYETDLGGHWISEEPRGGDFIEWLLQFIGELRIVDRAACDEIRDRKEEINESLVSSEIIYEYYNPEDDTFSCHWEERRTQDEIEVKGFDAYSWEKVWSEQNHQEIAKLYNGSIDNIENLSPGECPLWKLLAEGWNSHSSGPEFVRKMMDKYATFRVSKNAGYENPEYDFLRKKTIDPDTIDFNGKTIGMAPVAYLYPDDNENKYYGSLGTAFDIAKTIVEQNGGKVTKSVSGNTDYVVVSNRMRVRDNRDAIRLSEDYRMYCDGQKRDREKIQESDERRKKKSKPEIRVIFEDEFHAWLRNKFDLMKQESDVFKAYGTINLMVRPFEISPGAYTFKFKSDWFADIPEEKMKEATENLETLSEFISNIESFTKEGVFAESGSTKKTYSQLMEINEKYKFSDYEEVYFIYESSGGVNYRIIKQTDPGFDIQHTTIDQLKEYPYIESGIRRKLMDGRKVKVRCRLSDETDNAEDGIKVLNDLAEKLSSAGHVEKGPEKENNSLCILIAPGRETSGDDSPLVFKRAKTIKSVNKVPIDALRINDHYDVSFLKEHGEEIKRVVVPEYAYSNSILLSHCPNIEEFIVAKNSSFSFEDGVLYSTSGNTRSIEYITKNVKELHIDKDITDISYWHGVNKLTIDKNNSKFVVKDNMLLSRRMNSLYFVCADAEEVVIPEGVAQIHSAAFEYCEKLRKIVFPASYEWRGWYAPPGGLILNTNEGMRGAEVILSGNNARYENEMVILNPDFHPDVKLYLGDTELCRIPDKLGSPYGLDEAFGKVKNFEIGEQNPAMASVDGVILDKGKTKLLYYPRERETFVIPDCVKSIGDMALSNCNRLKDVVIPDHVISIGNMAFANCASLTSVTVMNPAAVIAGNAFLGCNFDSDNNESEIIDEEELKRSIEEEIAKIEKTTSKGKKDKKIKSQDGPKKQFKYTDYLTFNLPEDFVVSTSTTDEGTEMTQLQWGDYQDEDSGDTLYQFTATLAEVPVETKSDGKELSPNEIIDAFINGSSGELTSRTYIAHGDIPYGFFSAEMPVEVPMGFFGNIVLKNYIVTLGVVADGKVIMAFSNGYQNPENDDDKEKEDLLYEKLVEIVKGISVNGVPIDCQDLDEEKLRDAIEPLFSDSESTFSLNFGTQEEQKPEVRFAEDDDRKVIVDDKWSFVLPEGLDLRFDSEHVDIMGNSTTSKYVVEGLQYNGRFFFDFELRERFDDGMSTDVDVIGCRFDNDVSSGNAQQRIISDGDDLFVDMVNKPIFFFNSMTSIRVRGEEIRSWDFTAGMSSTDQDMSARWDEVKKLMLELAESIQLIGGSKKTAKKKKTQKQSDPDFIITNGVLRKYVGKDTDIVIPNGIKEIADSTFSGFTKLRSVVVPEGVKRIGRRCFENCTSLERCDLPDSLEELGGYAFVDCHKLKEVHLGKKLKSLGDSTFSECFVLNDVVIPEKIKEIEAFAFKNCDAFKHIVIPEGVKSIGFSAFAGCDKLEYLYIPKSVTEFAANSFNPHPFDGSKKLTIYTPAGSAAQKFAVEKGIPYKNEEMGSTAADKAASSTTAQKKASTSKKTTKSKSSNEKTVTVDNTWAVTIPTGFKYSTDKSIIGNHRNIIFMEDNAENMFEWPFDASISFTSAFNESPDWQFVTKTTVGIMSGGKQTVLRDDDDIYVAYWYDKDRCFKDANSTTEIFQIHVGCGNGASGIQVFFNDSKLSHKEQTKLVEKVAKSIKLAEEASSYSSTSTSSSATGLTPEQQRQKDELNRQIEDLKSQASMYSSQYLSSEDRQVLADAKEGIAQLEKQMEDFSATQDKYAEHLRQREEQERKREEERQRKIAEAMAAGKTEDDLINMFVILSNEAKTAKYEKTQKEFFEAYNEYFPAYKTRELASLRKEVKEKIKDKEIRKYYSDCFRKRSVKGRFDVVTDAYFNLGQYKDYALRAEDAIIKTAEWYSADEMPEVRKLMKDLMDRLSKSVDDAFSSLANEWKKYWSAKKDLKIMIRNGSSEDLQDDRCLFQIRDGRNVIGNPVIVEVILATQGLLQLSTSVLNFFPYYWDASLTDIWETARRNEILDNSTAWMDDKDTVVRDAFKLIKDKYPDSKATLATWSGGFSRSARTFGRYISSLYSNIDKHFTVAEIKENLKSNYKTANDLAEGKEALFETAKSENLTCLRDLLKTNTDIKELYSSIPKTLSEDIKAAREKKQFEANENKYKEASALLEGDSLKDLNKAEVILNELGSFKDSKDLLKQVSASLDKKKSGQYDEAKTLFYEGTETSVLKAIEKLDELGQYKDAPDLSKEYWSYLKKERSYQNALKAVESEELNELRDAKTKLEGLSGFKNADELLITCIDKIDAAQEKIYLKAIDLASEGTENSLKEAISLMNTISSYKDSDSKMKELREILDNERTYSNAVGLTTSREISDLIVAKGLFEKLGNYKDSVIKAAACDKYIDELCENKYQEARQAENVYTLTSQKDAISKYNQLGDYKDSFERKKKCSTNCMIIQKMQDLEKEIEAHKKELAAITGAFKKKERQAKEVLINQKEKRLSELRSELTEEPVEVLPADQLGTVSSATAGSNEVQVDVETISEEESELAVVETITETVTETTNIPAQQPVKKKPEKKSKKGLLILIVLMLLAVIAAVLYLTGVLYISPDADNCQIEEYIHSGGTTADKALTIEESEYTIDDYDNLEVVYRITNKSEDDIWDLYGNVAFLDKNDKELCTSGFSYRGLLKPGKSVYLNTGSYDVKSKKIARAKLSSYNYSVGQTDYLVDLTTGKIEKGASDYEYYSNADYEMTNCLTFEINNRGLDEYNYYNVDVTTSNNGTTPVRQVSIYVDFLDKDGNIIDQRNAYIENELSPSRSLMSEATGYEQIEGDGSTKLIDSTVINRYEYYLNSDDRYGNNYYSVDLVNGIAYGTHYDN